MNDISRRCPQLKVTPDREAAHLSIVEVVVHFTITMATSVPNNTLLTPITTLITDPATMHNCFLPTMPEDERHMLLKAILANEAKYSGGYTGLYVCPNGHPYLIGNCGRPVSSGRCQECGQVIGGQKYTSAAGNVTMDMTDKTQPGHSLGPAASRRPEPSPERAMTPACTVLVRLLVHLGLYVGANSNTQGVHMLITPAIQEEEVANFLWEHIQCDIDHLACATARGWDDALLLVHLFIHHISSITGEGCTQDLKLSTKEARGNWEKAFSERVVNPLLTNLEEAIRNGNQELTEDVRQENNVLRRLVHEYDTGIQYQPTPAAWRYRTRVSIEHLRKSLMAAGSGDQLQQYEVLRLFLTEEPKLRAVRYIPRVLHFVRMLTELYDQKIDRTEANEIPFTQVLSKIIQDDKRKLCEDLFDDFAAVWTIVHTFLQTHVSAQLKPLRDDYWNQEITRNTKLSTFLPCERGPGMCAYALLHYLHSVHNKFMDDYCRITQTPERATVNFADVTASHLVDYDPDQDLLPLVVANCTYSLEVGKGTPIEYNFRNLEQQLQERFFKGKAKLDFQLEQFSFHEDLNNAALFKDLQKKIPQKSMSESVQRGIRGECRFMIEITDCLRSLDITIGFLVSIGGDPEMLLSDFMTDTVGMDAGMLMSRARQHCRLCHSQALWLLLCHEREKLAVKNNQEPFMYLDSSEYCVPLSDEMKQDFRKALLHMKVDPFLTELHECIVLHLTINTNPHDEDQIDNRKHPLREAIADYITYIKDGTPAPALTNGEIPPEITVDQCVDTWRTAYTFLRQVGI